LGLFGKRTRLRSPKRIRHNGRRLTEILAAHERFIKGQEGGTRGDLTGADLARADFRAANLTGAILCGANLEGASFVKAKLSFANLERARMRGADLRNADLTEAHLKEADLTDALISGVEALRADFSGACLRGANLSVANLRDTILRGADFRGANMTTTVLRETFDSQALDLLIERGKRDLETLRGFGLIPVGPLEHVHDDAALDFLEDLEQRMEASAWRCARRLLLGIGREKFGQLQAHAANDFACPDVLRQQIGVHKFLSRGKHHRALDQHFPVREHFRASRNPSATSSRRA
jgi:hypothetical protein